MFPRTLTQGKVGRWLVAFDLGGQVFRFATVGPVQVDSTEWGPVLFSSGMSSFSTPLTVDSIRVRVLAPPGTSWDEVRGRLGPFTGRRVRVWRWYPGQTLDEAFLIMDGTVSSPEYADPDSPTTLTFRARRDPDLSVAWPRPEDVLLGEDDSWTQTGSNFIISNLLGRHYPTIIGAPGDVRTAGGTPFFGAPGLIVQRTASTTTIVVAGHHVQAAQVRLYSTKLNTTGILSVTNTADNQGVLCATVTTSSTVLDADDEVYIGWSRDASWGVGLTDLGRPILGLGDLLIWGSRNLTTSRWDFGEMASQRADLNRIRIDTYWNDSMTWDAWLSSNVLNLYPVAEVQGRRGRYYKMRRWVAVPTDVQGRLGTGGAAGRQVERVSAITEADVKPVNIVQVEYAERPTTGTARRKLVVGPSYHPEPRGPTGTSNITIGGADQSAARSETYLGPRYKVLKLPNTWDDVTADVVAREVLATSALPGRRVRVVGGGDLLEFEEWSTVRYIDSTVGASIDELAIVEDVEVTDAGVTLQLWIPDRVGGSYG